MGAVTAPVIGGIFHYGMKGIAHLLGKAKDRQIKEAQNTQDFNDIAQNELFQNPLLREDGMPSITPAHADEKAFVDTVFKK